MHTMYILNVSVISGKPDVQPIISQVINFFKNVTLRILNCVYPNADIKIMSNKNYMHMVQNSF